MEDISEIFQGNTLLDGYFLISVLIQKDIAFIFDYFHTNFHMDIEEYNILLLSISSILNNKDIFISFFYSPMFSFISEQKGSNMHIYVYKKYSVIFIEQLEFWKINNINILKLMMESEMLNIIIQTADIQDEPLIFIHHIFSFISNNNIQFGMDINLLQELQRIISEHSAEEEIEE